MGARNLPFCAGTAVANGLDYEAAIQALTLDASEILGIENKLGSIEVGKEATFFISNGDALDISTNDIQYAFIKGILLDLDNYQKKLYRKYNSND